MVLGPLGKETKICTEMATCHTPFRLKFVREEKYLTVLYSPWLQCGFLKSRTMPDSEQTHLLTLASGSRATQMAPRSLQFFMHGESRRDGMAMTSPGPRCFHVPGTCSRITNHGYIFQGVSVALSTIDSSLAIALCHYVVRPFWETKPIHHIHHSNMFGGVNSVERNKQSQET